MIENEDVLELIDLLNKHQVKFLLVGGYAVIHYAEPRYTKDVDLFVEASSENAQNIFNALVEFGLSADQINQELFEMEGNFFKLGAPPWRVDLITSLKGVSFTELYERSQSLDIAGHQVKVVSREDLICIKQNAGRPQDLIDVEKLSS